MIFPGGVKTSAVAVNVTISMPMTSKTMTVVIGKDFTIHFDFPRRSGAQTLG